ncbi:MAG: Fic family protein, partial [Candidatus Heimdallarchaeota archaeon]|nr:Fic family protein [Candidatus Heimdallarchaeota archaeon]
MATYPNGAQKVIFNTTEPSLVPDEMEQLIIWTNQNIRENKIHPLIVTGLFIYEFLSIHPFHDGNGRLSRLLTTFLLLKQDYNFIKYVSFEHLIEESKKDYYASLMECQKNRHTENEKIDVWIIFFLDSIRKLSAKLNIKIQETGTVKNIYLNERQKQIVSFIEKNNLCKIGDIHRSFSETSINTLKKDMK